jgi:hypothetical protein
VLGEILKIVLYRSKRVFPFRLERPSNVADSGNWVFCYQILIGKEALIQMKKVFLLAMALFCLIMAGTSHATLWDRGGGLIFDDHLNITWLQDANLTGKSFPSTNWDEAVAAAEALVYGGFDDWRLPTTVVEQSGYNITSSEMGYMYYVNLGNEAMGASGWTGTPNATFLDGNGNVVSFQNLQADDYWSGTTYSGSSSNAWLLSFGSGNQYN